MAEDFRKHWIEARKVHLKNVFPFQTQHEICKNLMRNVVFSVYCKNEVLNCSEALFRGPERGGWNVQYFSFMTIILFFQDLAKSIASEHDEVMTLIVEKVRIFCRIVASTTFAFLEKGTLGVYVFAARAIKSLLLLKCLKSIDFRRRKKHKFAFLQGFIWFKVNGGRTF